LFALLGVLMFVWAAIFGLPQEFTLLTEGAIFGAALRDIGIARRTIRLWSIQKDLFDWAKIESLARDFGI
jgi:hypothetical protein